MTINLVQQEVKLGITSHTIYAKYDHLYNIQITICNELTVVLYVRKLSMPSVITSRHDILCTIQNHAQLSRVGVVSILHHTDLSNRYPIYIL